MSLSGPPKEDILGVASLNFLLNETVEAWYTEADNKQLVQFTLPEHILAFIIHISFLAVGFKPVKGRNEENTLKLSSDWNRCEPYEFHYTHAQSQFHFQLKSIALSKRLLIHASAEEMNEILTLEAIPDELLSEKIDFPCIITTETLGKLDICHYFNSHSKLTKFITDFRQRILQKLIPGLHKEGYQEISSAGNSAPNSPHPTTETHKGADVNTVASKASDILATEQDFNSLRNSNKNTTERDQRPSTEFSYNSEYDRSNYPRGANPFAYGDRDLNPIGGLPGMGGSALDPLGLKRNDEGGMMLGPRHPLFNSGPDFSPLGDPRRLPPGAAPPGARFDPITPLGSRPDPRLPPRRGPQFPFSGEPDNDEAPPPGYDNMFM